MERDSAHLTKHHSENTDYKFIQSEHVIKGYSNSQFGFISLWGFYCGFMDIGQYVPCTLLFIWGEQV